MKVPITRQDIRGSSFTVFDTGDAKAARRSLQEAGFPIVTVGAYLKPKSVLFEICYLEPGPNDNYLCKMASTYVRDPKLAAWGEKLNETLRFGYISSATYFNHKYTGRKISTIQPITFELILQRIVRCSW